MDEWDVVIVGAGPTGLFAAMEIKKLSPAAKVLVVELGKDLEERKCPLKTVGRCIACPICDIVSGFGGAGTFSDGKLNLTKDIGGDLASFIGNDKIIWDLIDYVDEVFLRLGAPRNVYGEDKEAIERLKSRALRSGLLLVPFRIRHMGSDGGYKVLKNFREMLLRMGVPFRFGVAADSILTDGSKVKGVALSNGEEIEAKYLVIAPGRVGASWLIKEAKRLGLKMNGGDRKSVV